MPLFINGFGGLVNYRGLFLLELPRQKLGVHTSSYRTEMDKLIDAARSTTTPRST